MNRRGVKNLPHKTHKNGLLSRNSVLINASTACIRPILLMLWILSNRIGCCPTYQQPAYQLSEQNPIRSRIELFLMRIFFTKQPQRTASTDPAE